MKAPTADYSPLSQAMNARSSAIQAGYAAKDAGNWSSRMAISENQIKASNMWTGIGLGLNLAQLGVNYAQKLEDINESKDNQNGALASTEAQNNVDKVLMDWQKSGKPMMVKDHATGQDTWDYDLERQVRDAVGSAYGKYEFKTKDQGTMQKVQDNTINSVLNSMQSSWMNQQANDANNAFKLNYGTLMTDAYQNEGTPMVSVSVPAGDGTTRMLQVPSSVNRAIDSMTYWTPEQKDLYRAMAAEDYANGKASFSIEQLYTALSTGRFVSADAEGNMTFDAESFQKAMDYVSANIDQISNVQNRDDMREKAKAGFSAGASHFIASQISEANDSGINVATKIENISKALQDGGWMHSMFYDKDGNPYELMQEGTLAAARTNAANTVDEYVKMNGTENSTTVKNGFDSIKRNPSLSPSAKVTKANEVMVAAYGNDWRINDEAMSVYHQNLYDIMSQTLKDSGQLSNSVSLALSSAYKGLTSVKDVLASDEKGKQFAMQIEADMEKRLWNYILSSDENSSAAFDEGEMVRQLTTMAGDYTSQWAGFLATNTNKRPEVDAVNEINKELEAFQFSINNGLVDLVASDMMLPYGIAGDVRQDVINLGTYVKNEGYYIEPSLGNIYVGDDGKVSKVEWTTTDGNAVVSFDPNTKQISARKSIGSDYGNGMPVPGTVGAGQTPVATPVTPNPSTPADSPAKPVTSKEKADFTAATMAEKKTGYDATTFISKASTPEEVVSYAEEKKRFDIAQIETNPMLTDEQKEYEKGRIESEVNEAMRQRFAELGVLDPFDASSGSNPVPWDSEWNPAKKTTDKADVADAVKDPEQPKQGADGYPQEAEDSLKGTAYANYPKAIADIKNGMDLETMWDNLRNSSVWSYVPDKTKEAMKILYEWKKGQLSKGPSKPVETQKDEPAIGNVEVDHEDTWTRYKLDKNGVPEPKTSFSDDEKKVAEAILNSFGMNAKNAIETIKNIDTIDSIYAILTDEEKKKYENTYRLRRAKLYKAQRKTT